MQTEPMSGAELRRERRALKLSQATLAQALGVGINRIYHWEKGLLDSLPHSKMVRRALQGIRQQIEADRAAAEKKKKGPPSVAREDTPQGRHWIRRKRLEDLSA